MSRPHLDPAVPAQLPTELQRILDQGAPLLAGAVAAGSDGLDVRLWYPVHLDGLSKQALMVGIEAVTRAQRLVMAAVDEIAQREALFGTLVREAEESRAEAQAAVDVATVTARQAVGARLRGE